MTTGARFLRGPAVADHPKPYGAGGHSANVFLPPHAGGRPPRAGRPAGFSPPSLLPRLLAPEGFEVPAHTSAGFGEYLEGSPSRGPPGRRPFDNWTAVQGTGIFVSCRSSVRGGAWRAQCYIGVGGDQTSIAWSRHVQSAGSLSCCCSQSQDAQAIPRLTPAPDRSSFEARKRRLNPEQPLPLLRRKRKPNSRRQIRSSPSTSRRPASIRSSLNCVISLRPSR